VSELRRSGRVPCRGGCRRRPGHVDRYSRCADCGYVDESRASPAVFDDVDGIVRQTLVARVGLTRLHVDPDKNRYLRLRSLAVFRGRGATITEVADVYAALTGHGLTGTPAEMSVLAEQLTVEGVQVVLQQARHPPRAANSA
jgi:hypothetical protein